MDGPFVLSGEILAPRAGVAWPRCGHLDGAPVPHSGTPPLHDGDDRLASSGTKRSCRPRPGPRRDGLPDFRGRARPRGARRHRHAPARRPRGGPQALPACSPQGWASGLMRTLFFLSRRPPRPAERSAMPAWQDKPLIGPARRAGEVSIRSSIPSDRVVEAGSQLTV